MNIGVLGNTSWLLQFFTPCNNCSVKMKTVMFPGGEIVSARGEVRGSLSSCRCACSCYHFFFAIEEGMVRSIFPEGGEKNSTPVRFELTPPKGRD